MARLARVIAVDTPRHVAQRGSARQFVLESDAGRLISLQPLQRHCRLHRPALYRAYPVRAGLVAEPAAFPWSSAAIHCAPAVPDSLLDLSPWRSVWSPQTWREFLAETVPAEQTLAIRQTTHTGRPLGSPGFVRQMEITLRRRLTPAKGGRPPKEAISPAQLAFSFGHD
ncbi:MAG: hypothetical protein WB579_24935 [Bryobacteraceae bacterium]